MERYDWECEVADSLMEKRKGVDNVAESFTATNRPSFKGGLKEVRARSFEGFRRDKRVGWKLSSSSSSSIHLFTHLPKHLCGKVSWLSDPKRREAVRTIGPTWIEGRCGKFISRKSIDSFI